MMIIIFFLRNTWMFLRNFLKAYIYASDKVYLAENCYNRAPPDFIFILKGIFLEKLQKNRLSWKSPE